MARAIKARADRMKRSGGRAGVLAAAGVMALMAFGNGVERAPVADGALQWGTPAFAQRRNRDQNLNHFGQECVSSGTQSKQVVDAYTAADALINPPAEATEEEQEAFTPNYAEAGRVIRRVMDRNDDLSPGEQAILLRLLAQIELSQENYPESIALLQRALNTGAVCGPQLAEAYYFIGTLYLVEENYDQSIEYLERFFAIVENPPSQAYYVMAQAYAVQEKWREARPYGVSAVSRQAEEDPTNPRENYMALLVAIHINLNEWREAVLLLERMVGLFPGKDNYWLQLAAGYQELKRERDAYAVQELRYKQGFLDSSREIMVLAELHAYYQYPYKAAKLVETEMAADRVEKTADNYEKMGNYWLAAQEFAKAREALLIAESNSDDGKIAYQIGSTYAQDENWAQAERFILRAFRKGGLNESERANGWMVVGTARFYLDRPGGALEAFRRARAFPATRRVADTWINFLEQRQLQDQQEREAAALTKLNDMLGKNQTELTDVEALSDLALTALETARRARDASSAQQRNTALEEYRIRVQQANTILERQREVMDTDIPESREAVAELRSLPDTSADAKRAADELEAMIEKRIGDIEKAEADLDRAAKIVEFINGNGPDPDVVDPEPESDGEGGENQPTVNEDAASDAEEDEASQEETQN